MLLSDLESVFVCSVRVCAFLRPFKDGLHPRSLPHGFLGWKGCGGKAVLAWPQAHPYIACHISKGIPATWEEVWLTPLTCNISHLVAVRWWPAGPPLSVSSPHFWSSSFIYHRRESCGTNSVQMKCTLCVKSKYAKIWYLKLPALEMERMAVHDSRWLISPKIIFLFTKRQWGWSASRRYFAIWLNKTFYFNWTATLQAQLLLGGKEQWMKSNLLTLLTPNCNLQWSLIRFGPLTWTPQRPHCWYLIKRN